MLAFADATITTGLLYLYFPFLISTTFHEASHALVAKLLGDQTAYLGGQVSLNPLPHIQREPFGMVVLPLLVLFMTGFSATMGFAHIPVDAYWAERNPKRAAMVSLAGPAANFVLAAIAFGVLYWLIRTDINIHDGNGMVASRLITGFLIINVILGILNLVPLPPLDGAGVVGGFFPRSVGPLYSLLRSQPFIMLLLLVLVMRYGSGLYLPVFEKLQDWLHGGR